MMKHNESTDQNKYLDRYSLSVFYLLVGGMMSCVVISIVNLGQFVLPTWNGTYLVLAGFIISIEGMYSQRFARRLNLLEPEWILYRGSELVVILLFTSLLYFIKNGFNLLVDYFIHWNNSTYQILNDYELFFALITGLFIWVLSSRIGNELLQLESGEETQIQEDESGVFVERSEARSQIVNIILFIGVIMIFLTAILRMEVIQNWAQMPLMKIGVYNLIIYFLLALLLLSLTQFSLMRKNWYYQSIEVGSIISKNWFLYSLGFISLLALLSSILPTDYSFSFFQTLSNFIGYIIQILLLILYLIITPILIIFSFMMSFFGTSTTSMQSEPLDFSSISPAINGNQPNWIEFIKSLFYWIIFVGVIVYSFRYYLRMHKFMPSRLINWSIFQRLWLWLQQIRKLFWDMQGNLKNRLEEGLKRIQAPSFFKKAEVPWRYISLRRLSPREQVQFYYIAMVRHGEKAGLVRNTNQTPYEYSKKIINAIIENRDDASSETIDKDIEKQTSEKILMQVPQKEFLNFNYDIVNDIDSLTECFIEARYSLHSITEQKSSSAKIYWQRIRREIHNHLNRK